MEEHKMENDEFDDNEGAGEILLHSGLMVNIPKLDDKQVAGMRQKIEGALRDSNTGRGTDQLLDVDEDGTFTYAHVDQITSAKTKYKANWVLEDGVVTIDLLNQIQVDNSTYGEILLPAGVGESKSRPQWEDDGAPGAGEILLPTGVGDRKIADDHSRTDDFLNR